MADVDDHKPVSKPDHEDNAHAGLSLDDASVRASIPEKTTESGGIGKSAISSLSDKVHEDFSPSDWRNLGRGQFAGVSGSEAASLLSWNPLGDQAERGLEGVNSRKGGTAVLDRDFDFNRFSAGLSDFQNYGLDRSHYFGDKFNGTFADPFANGRAVDSLNSMGMQVSDLGGAGAFAPSQVNSFKFDQGNTGFNWDDMTSNSQGWFVGDEAIMNSNDMSVNDNGSLNLGESFTNAFWADSVKDASAGQDTASQPKEGFGDSIMDGAKDLFHKAEHAASAVWDATGGKIGNATIDWLGDAKQEPTGKSAQPVETSISGDQRTFKMPSETVTQSKVDKDGVHEHTSVQTTDGRTLSQDNGVRTMENKNSDITVKHNTAEGKFEVFDKSGKEIAEFNSEGDAKRFFDNSYVDVVKPGQNLNDAYQKYLKEHPDQADKDHPGHLNKPILLMDGKGETLTVQPDGSKLYTHANGDVDGTYVHKDAQGNPQNIVVQVRGGKITIGREGGQQLDPNSDEGRRILQDSRLKVDQDGNLQVNQDTSGDWRRERWERFLDHHRHLHIFHGGDIDLLNKHVTIDDDKTHAEYSPNTQTGVVTETETNRKADGTLDPHPSRVTTIDHTSGKVTVQGVDPETGAAKPDDVVTFNERTNTVDAWHMESNPNDAQVMGPDGSITTIDPNGDVNALDADGNSLLDTKGDDISYDGGRSWTSGNREGSDSYSPAELQQVENNAIQTATTVLNDAIAYMSGGNLTEGDIANLMQALDQATSQLPSSIPIPQQVVDARTALQSLQAKLDDKNKNS